MGNPVNLAGTPMLVYPVAQDANGNNVPMPSGAGATSPMYVASVGGAPTTAQNSFTGGAAAKAITTGATSNGPGVYTQGIEITVITATGTVYWGGSGVTSANGVPHVQGDRFTVSVSDPSTVFMVGASAFTIAFGGN